MEKDKNLNEYLIEVSVENTNLQGIVDALIQNGLQLDKTFRPKKLKVKPKPNRNSNFLIKGWLAKNASFLLQKNHNVTNFWQSSGTIPFQKKYWSPLPA